MKHTVESCPLSNADVLEKFKELVRRREEAAAKHGVRVLVALTSVLDHLIFYFVDAPSQEAVESYFKEIGFASWNNIEIRQVKQVEEVLGGIEKT